VNVMQPSILQVGLAVRELHWRHHREANRRLQAQAGLSLKQWEVIRQLRREPEASLHDLAMRTFQTDQSMGELAKRMVDRGLLARVEGPGRAVRHRVTSAGEAAYEAGSGVVDGVLAETVGSLTPDEQATLHAMLTKAAAGPGDSGPARPEQT
jgi:DNA-binding MarR family transcriptional regulator